MELVLDRHGRVVLCNEHEVLCKHDGKLVMRCRLLRYSMDR